MGKKEKNRGKSYEYRVRDWFRQRPGWDKEKTIRVPLSGACTALDNPVGKHDIVAIHENGLRVDIECKKTGAQEISLQKTWIDKLNYSKQEFLVFAMDRTKHYCLFPISIFNNTDIETTKVARGNKSCKISKEDFVNDKLKFQWCQQTYYILLLEEYISLLERERK